MPADLVGTPQLSLFASHTPVYQDTLAHDEAIRPILTRERTLVQQSRATGLNYWPSENDAVTSGKVETNHV
jgi:hypothetical protein